MSIEHVIQILATLWIIVVALKMILTKLDGR